MISNSDLSCTIVSPNLAVFLILVTVFFFFLGGRGGQQYDLVQKDECWCDGVFNMDLLINAKAEQLQKYLEENNGKIVFYLEIFCSWT